MRIIAGFLKGMKLKKVKSESVRPTRDRVKESLFQIIGPTFEGCDVLDLFAGTGSLGLESLSRGTDFVVFVDNFYPSIVSIKENISKANLEKKTKVYFCDYRKALSFLSKQQRKFEYIFLDPPYNSFCYKKILKEIFSSKVLKEGGFVILECPNYINLPHSLYSLKLFRRIDFKNTKIYIYTNV